jgi:hypothetical protein
MELAAASGAKLAGLVRSYSEGLQPAQALIQLLENSRAKAQDRAERV